MEKFNLEDEQRQALMEGASWGSAGLSLVEQAAEAVEEAKGGYKEPGKSTDVPGDVNVDAKAMKVGGSKGDAVSRKAKGSEGLAEEEEAAEELEYVCPLCESHLDEELSEERISDHLDFVVELLSEADADAEGETLEEEDEPEEDTVYDEDNA